MILSGISFKGTLVFFWLVLLLIFSFFLRNLKIRFRAMLILLEVDRLLVFLVPKNIIYFYLGPDDCCIFVSISKSHPSPSSLYDTFNEHWIIPFAYKNFNLLIECFWTLVKYIIWKRWLPYKISVVISLERSSERFYFDLKTWAVSRLKTPPEQGIFGESCWL